MVRDSRHIDLGHFLRTRRERLDIGKVGLPTSPNRRSPGLRREEVAFLANVSPAWYARLEQGGKVRPSVEVLDSLAAALELDPVERRYLHTLAADRPLTRRVDVGHDTLAMVRRLIETQSGLDWPAFAVDGRGQLLAWNPPTTEWYADFTGTADRPQNLLWWLFTAAEARTRILDWESHGREMVATLRYLVGTSSDDDAVTELVGDLCRHCPEFDGWWSNHDVGLYEAQQRTFRHPDRGVCEMELLTVRPVLSSSVAVVFHVPGG